MALSDCPSIEDLQRLLTRQLNDAASAVVETHIEGCAHCQTTLEELTNCRAKLGWTSVAPPIDGGDSAFWSAVKGTAPAPPPGAVPSSPPTGPFRWPGTELSDDSGQRELKATLQQRLPASLAMTAIILGLVLVICRTGIYGEFFGPVGEQLIAGTFNPWSEALLAVTVATLAGSAALIRLHASFSLRSLRRLETTNFALLFVLLAVWQFRLLLARPPDGFSGQTHQDTWILFGNYAGLLYWIMVMSQIGFFLPQTPGRCTAFIAVELLAANAATLTAAAVDPAVARMMSFLLTENALALLGGAALCIYSTVKARALETDLRAARRQVRDLGQYRLKARLGSGGMGEVYLAEHRLLKRPCAVKLIHPEKAGDAAVLRRFEREVQATARLRHPNTVDVFDYGCAEDGTFYYVMEYLNGLSFDQLVQQHGPLPTARVVHLVRQVCGALREAHDAGLVHRDIKPGNVFVCRGGPPDRVKLLDFGLVRSTDSVGPSAHLTQHDHLLGTPGYMAPEQIEGAETVTAQADLYSLGAVAYYLLTGEKPLARDTPMRTLIAHLHEAPPPLRDVRPEVTPELEAVVMRCLSKAPADRYASAADLERALAGCSQGSWTEDDAAAWWATRPAE